MEKLKERVRKAPRVYPGMEAHDLTLADLGPHDIRAEIEQKLIAAGFNPVVYDGDARAYTQKRSPARREPVLLTNWQGIEGGGTRVVIRGRGAVQRLVQECLEELGVFSPDQNEETEKDVKIFTFVEKSNTR